MVKGAFSKDKKTRSEELLELKFEIEQKLGLTVLSVEIDPFSDEQEVIVRLGERTFRRLEDRHDKLYSVQNHKLKYVKPGFILRPH